MQTAEFCCCEIHTHGSLASSIIYTIEKCTPIKGQLAGLDHP